MKKSGLIIFNFLIFSLLLSAQETKINLSKNLNQIEEGTFKGTMLNSKLVQGFLIEYKKEAEKRDVPMDRYLENIYFILIEPESNNPRELNEFNLGKIDKDRKMILLSSICLLDQNILKATLFRELSHYLGVPYIVDGLIMSINKPEGYSYAWLSCYGNDDIRKIEYDTLFKELKKVIN